MRGLTGSFMAVPTCHLVRKVTVLYARWWHKIAGATCTVKHISKQSSKSKRKGDT